jgi:hypothetical protein
LPGSQSSHVNSPNGARYAILLRQPAHEFFILVRIDSAQLVVYMKDVQALASYVRHTTAIVDIERRGGREHKQRGRVRSSRYHKHHRSHELWIRMS